MQSTIVKYFAFAHLPAHLQAVSKPIGELANLLEQQLPDGPEKSVGMRKLLEAKDCFVRAALEAPNAMTEPVTATMRGGETVTFEEFVQYGCDNGGNIVGGMPWSFSFRGHPVTHENDSCYLVGVNEGQVRFTSSDVLVINPDGTLTTCRAEATHA